MPHRVIRNIDGRDYEYEEESYRVPGLKTPRKRSRYIGPVDAIRKRKTGILGFIDDLVRAKHPWEEGYVQTEKERQAWMKEWEAARAKQDRINAILTAPTMPLEALHEEVALQQSLHPAPSFTAPASVSRVGEVATVTSSLSAPEPVAPGSETPQSDTKPGE